jgi:hypothetical protein
MMKAIARIRGLFYACCSLLTSIFLGFFGSFLRGRPGELAIFFPSPSGVLNCENGRLARLSATALLPCYYRSTTLEPMSAAPSRPSASRILRQKLLTPNLPTAGFSVGGAMGRNKIIYGLADFAVVVSSDFQTGGTWAGAVEALKGGWCPVFVREGT